MKNGFLKKVLNFWFSYRGAERWSADRSFIPGWVQDQRFDASQVTRLELVRKSRYFEKNNAIYNRLVDLFEQFTVGHAGLQIIPNSSSEAWNQAAAQWFDEWERVCDVSSLTPFSTIQSQVARAWFTDGEIFILKTRGQPRKDQPPFPRIQLVETHRVNTPAEYMQQEGLTIVDGVQVDPIGRPLSYYVRTGFSLDAQTYEPVPADNIIHIFEAERAGQIRGLPFCYPVINDLTDLDDLQILEMRAAKDAAEKSTFILNQAGELPRETVRRAKYSTVTQVVSGDIAGTEINEDRLRRYNKALGGKMFALKIGEDVKQFIPQRPSVATKEYWDYLTSKVCAGVGISKMLVFPFSVQGTVARAELDVANAFFRARSGVLSEAFVRIYLYVIGWGIKNDPRLKNAPKDWDKYTVRAPRAVNVDVGRQSSAMIQQLDAGMINYDMIYGELGIDWRRALEQKAKEAAYIKELATQYKVDENDIAERIPLKTGKGLGGGGDSQDVPAGN